MTPDQFKRVDDLFTELVAMAEAERAAALAAIDDAEVRAEVISLLSYAVETNAMPMTEIGGVLRAVTGEQAEREVGPGSRFGHYKIERRLGRGGMGDVYEASRDGDFRKRVALKIIRHGADSGFGLQRFQQERQVLANLEHPYIARLLDGGEDGGTPYLVLEFVDGVTIDQYCLGKSADEILRLFLKVCEALAYAHRNLVIHRDVKPANILVTADGEPKLLDFGIAKLIEAGADMTRTGFAPHTPQYASPEQIRAGAITTSTDVYSLGVVLYELLTGHKPYDLATATPFEMDALVCTTEPVKPGVSEDLDNIILMAMRKETARRYASPDALAGDIRRYLEGFPVRARPDTAAYRLGKFARRHWVGLAAALAVVASSVAGTVVAVGQARRASDRLAQVQQLSNKLIFDLHDEIAALPGATKARLNLVETGVQYLDTLRSDAGSSAPMLLNVALGYNQLGQIFGGTVGGASLGDSKRALELIRKSLETASGVDAAKLNQAELDQLATVYVGAMQFLNQIRKTDDARAVMAKGLAIEGRCGPSARSRLLREAGRLEGMSGDPRKGLAYLDEAEPLAKEAGRGNPKAALGWASIYSFKAIAQRRLGQIEEAFASYRTGVAIDESVFGGDPLNTHAVHDLNVALTAMADLLAAPDRFNLGRPAEAEPLYRRALAMAEKELAADERNQVALFNVARNCGKLGSLLAESKPAESLALMDRALALTLKASAANADRTPFLVSYNLESALPLAGMGRFAEARKNLAEARRLDPDAAATADWNLARVEAAARRWDEARTQMAKAIPGVMSHAMDPKGTPEDANTAAAALGFALSHAAELKLDRAEVAGRQVALWREWEKRMPDSTYVKARLAAALTESRR